MSFLRPLLSARTSFPLCFRPLVSRQPVRWNSLVNIPPRCPSCSQPLPSSLLACPSCWSIFPLSANISHHQVFGLPEEPNPFVVDLSALKSRFRRAQAACHPDAWATKSPKQQDLAHILSSRLNEAYQSLLNPLSRAEYILQRNGFPMSEHDQVEDVDFMAGIMEARELIDDADQGDRATVDDLIIRNNEDMQLTIEDLKTWIEQRKWSDAKAAAIRLRYQQGIDRAAKKMLDNI